LRGHRVAYHAHSSGYGFDLPAGVPVLAVSRNTLGYWGARAPRNPLCLVPNALEDPGSREVRVGSKERVRLMFSFKPEKAVRMCWITWCPHCSGLG
jgi:hypothetical protein